jgi:hypothetical protein
MLKDVHIVTAKEYLLKAIKEEMHIWKK